MRPRPLSCTHVAALVQGLSLGLPGAPYPPGQPAGASSATGSLMVAQACWHGTGRDCEQKCHRALQGS